ncbi:MAG: PP2C family serine/threonine-protein phosphatase [Thiohalobacterales bacterium]|nr:PP2C family serine/threonine-protein phosphatase [Thiohalobacterales bacterium]
MSVSLFAGVDLPAPELVAVDGGQACVFTERRPGRTTDNEDAAVVIPGAGGCCVLAVADGLGGLPAGDAAARMALQQLADHTAGQAGEQQRESVLSGLELANQAIMAKGQGAGTTVAVAAIDGHTVRTSIVGDSMIVVCGQRGRLKYRSVAHSPVGYAEATGMLDEDDAMFHAERHLVSNIVGTAGMHVEVGPVVKLALRDTLVLGSDGLFDNLYVGEVVELVRVGALETAAGRLLAACRQRMRESGGDAPHKPDDLTFILYRRNPESGS